MLGVLAAATLAVAPMPETFDLAATLPVHTVEEPTPTPEDATVGMYRIGKTKWTDDKQHADRINQAKVRRVLYHTLNAADLVTTVICLEARDNCREGNPIYGQSTELVVVGKVASAVVFEVLRDKNGGNAVPEWIAIGILGLVVGNNLTVVF